MHTDREYEQVRESYLQMVLDDLEEVACKRVKITPRFMDELADALRYKTEIL